MRSKKVISFFLVLHFFAFPIMGRQAKREQRPYLLPWEIIVEKFENRASFCTEASNKDRSSSNLILNYVLEPYNSIITFSKAFNPQLESVTKVNAAKWNQGRWQEFVSLEGKQESDGLFIEPEIVGKGFINFLLTVRDESNDFRKRDLYAIICEDWKKDLFAFCRYIKEQIETNPDLQLIRSSICTSHFDHVMEAVNKTSILSEDIFDALGKALKSKKEFDAGKYPDLVIGGLNKIRLRRFRGAGIAEFVVFIPNEYNDFQQYPLFLHPDPQRHSAKANYSSKSGFIDIWWHFPLPMGFEWKDYKHLLWVFNETINIDEDRIYVNGYCGNGISTMALALNYPDYWAECSIVLGNSYRHLAGNALNLPLIFVDQEHNEAYLEGYYDFAVKCFQYNGCRCFKYSKTRNLFHVRGSPVPKTVRKTNPQRVLYSIESLHNPKAYWVSIDGRKDENFVGTIDASVDGQTIIVRTNNVDAYSLDIIQAPIDSNKSVEIVENGHSLGFATDQIFTKRAEKYIDATYIKNQYHHGPIWDAFTEPYVVVWGTCSKDKEFSKTSEETALLLANGGPCIADINMQEELLNEYNLILVGTKESNSWLSKIYKDLPVQIKEGRIATNGKCWEGNDMGFILIYPNSLNLKRYIVVFSATSSLAMANIPDVYSQIKSINPLDVGIFEIVEKNEVKWHIAEKFNTVWDWHDEWNQVLAVTNKKHTKLQWRLWIARIIREQLEADVVFFEDVFKFEDSSLSGHLTYRDLFNRFRNDWIVKIMLDGKSLKDLLTVPFSDISRREVVAPIIYGVNFVKPEDNCEETVLIVSELENDKKYTVVLPYKAVNGGRMGTILKDYKIVRDGYLVSLLKDYLCKNKNLGIDIQLENLKSQIF